MESTGRRSARRPRDPTSPVASGRRTNKSASRFRKLGRRFGTGKSPRWCPANQINFIALLLDAGLERKIGKEKRRRRPSFPLNRKRNDRQVAVYGGGAFYLFCVGKCGPKLCDSYGHCWRRKNGPPFKVLLSFFGPFLYKYQSIYVGSALTWLTGSGKGVRAAGSFTNCNEGRDAHGITSRCPRVPA